jgi:hypothetical protein
MCIYVSTNQQNSKNKLVIIANRRSIKLDPSMGMWTIYLFLIDSYFNIFITTAFNNF